MMQTMSTRQPHAVMNTSLAGLRCSPAETITSARPSSHSSTSSVSSARSGHSLNSDAASSSSEAPAIGQPHPANSIKSSSTRSATSNSSSGSRIRTVRLVRPNSSAGARRKVLISTATSAAFGFAIRGGREFSIGFFVSRVEKGGEADLRGLRVGDQLIRVNGFAVDDAVHRELTQYVSGQDRLTLKVRGVGILPSKERATDQLAWMVVPKRMPHSSSVGHHKAEEFTCQDVRITLDVEPRTKLGLGICKGPEWKPGIFVQFTKEMGVARDAGLRPGDQLLSCNGVDFGDVLFSEAVAVMKSSQRLELIVRNAAGVELFPGESSGYNSSASSVTGDQSPCWGDQASKRLSIVREEDGSDKIGHMRPAPWDRQTDLDRRKEHRRPQPVDPPEQFSDTHRPSDKTNTTIIKLSETGTIINNTMVPLIHRSQPNNDPDQNHQNRRLSTEITVDQNTGDRSRNNIRVNITNSSEPGPNNRSQSGRTPDTAARLDANGDSQVADICFVSRKIETKTVTVEVHRGPTATSEPAPVIPPPPPPMSAMSTPFSSLTTTSTGRHSSLAASGPSSSVSCDAVSLSSAISDELKKRAERARHEVSAQKTLPEGEQRAPNKMMLKKVRSAFGGGPNDSDKHSALIDEFKLAHKKMFRNHATHQGEEEQEKKAETSQPADSGPMERQREHYDQTAGRGHDVVDHRPTRSDRVSVLRQTSPPGTPRPDYDRDTSPTNSVHLVFDSNKPAATPPSAAPNSRKGTMGRCAAHEMAKANGDAAELASIDSYKLINPASPEPKPPSLYFKQQSNGPATLMKPQRSVSVTIGEYAERKEMPKQFDFIARSPEAAPAGRAVSPPEASNRLVSELESTLTRSNLRAKNDSTAPLNTGEFKSNTRSISTPNGFHCPAAPTAAPLMTGRPVRCKTQSNVGKITAMLVSQNLMGSRPANYGPTVSDASATPPNGMVNGNCKPNGPNAVSSTTNGSAGNRVTINIHQYENEKQVFHRKSDTVAPINGILKNGGVSSASLQQNGGAVHAGGGAAGSNGGEPRNISFGQITTVLTDNL